MYSRYVVQLASNLLFYKFFYVDLLNHDSTVIKDEETIRINSYNILTNIISENISDIWTDKTVVVLVHIPSVAI